MHARNRLHLKAWTARGRRTGRVQHADRLFERHVCASTSSMRRSVCLEEVGVGTPGAPQAQECPGDSGCARRSIAARQLIISPVLRHVSTAIFNASSKCCRLREPAKLLVRATYPASWCDDLLLRHLLSGLVLLAFVQVQVISSLFATIFPV
jgi:hypothetical protein